MTDLDSRQRDRVDYADYLDDETRTDYRRYGRYGGSNVDHGGYEDDGQDYQDDHQDYDGPLSHRWRPVAITAAAVFLIAVIATAIILQGGGNGGTAGTVAAPPTRTVIATPPAPTTPQPAETVTTATPSPTPTTSAPSPAPTTSAPPATSHTTAAPVPDARTVTYLVTGTKPLLDLVTIVYTDEQGFPRTDVNVSLPWARRVVLNPGVTVKSVTASSLRSQLNCTITDATGQLIAQASTNSMLATCTR